MVGVAANALNLTSGERELMRGAGIRWLRSEEFGFDPEIFLSGERQPAQFSEARNQVAALRQEGFSLMGITPGPKGMPGIAGIPGSREYLDNYRRICAFLGSEFRGLIDFWQVANELDIWIFRDALSLDQSIDFLKSGIRGLSETGGQLNVGINITLFPSRPGEVEGNTVLHEGVSIARAIYMDPELNLSYAGFDSYPGSWRDGGAESWDDYLDQFHELTGKPIIIQEFGYSSAGDIMSESERSARTYPCKARKWRFSWRGGHTPEIQAQFIEESFKVFASKSFVVGATYFHWIDHEKCWQCGQSDCPIETAWGLVDRETNPKPSYYALRDSVDAYFARPV
jgi:hypothetical protein